MHLSIADGCMAHEIDVGLIHPDLQKIFSDDFVVCQSTFSVPTLEDERSAASSHAPAGSVVIVPGNSIDSFRSSQTGEFQPHTTYSFRLDRGANRQDPSRPHWNLRIYKTIHYGNGEKKLIHYDVPNFMDHIESDTITIELLDDNYRVIAHKTFEKDSSLSF